MSAVKRDDMGTAWSLGAYVIGASFNGSLSHAAFALGNGGLHILRADTPDAGQTYPVHGGACLTLAAIPRGQAFLSGGDDGRLNRTVPDGSCVNILTLSGRWIEHIAVDNGSSAFACAAGKEVYLSLDVDREPDMVLDHPSTVGGLCFSPDGQELAVSHYGGVSLWSVQRQARHKRTLEWRGSHLGVTWSPDGRYIVTAMQERVLHVFVLASNEHLFIDAYDRKVRSLCWSTGGRYLATSAAIKCCAGPSMGPTGPCNRAP